MIRLFFGLFFLLVKFSPNAYSGSNYHYGACDASAAVLLDNSMVLVADDEDNILRLYSIEKTGPPIKSFPLDKFLGVTNSSHPETDIEACTRIGNLIYWITSHGRSKKGKWRNSRYRLFATEFTKKNGEYDLQPRGQPCSSLINVLFKHNSFLLQKNIGQLGKNEEIFLAPKEKGLNIEGLTVSPDGKTLYIGLRNPLPNEKAILIPLKNAEEVILKNVEPILGDPIYLNLERRGIRSIEYSAIHNSYFIVGGPVDSELKSALYSWTGDEESSPKLILSFNDMNPEAITIQKNTKKIFVLSDDGNVKYNVSQNDSNEKLDDGLSSCKSLKNSTKKRFRSNSINIDEKKNNKNIN